MSTEQMTLDVDRRARVHAALAEPARVRIADHLALRDATPGELQELLGMSSNLVAHHLRVLEDEGLVRRHRSQADRRRTYVHLVADALDGLLSSGSSGPPAGRVVFVCTANTARSQLAAALWNSTSSVPATSAGTHPADGVAPGAIAVARRRRLPMRQVRPRSLDEVAVSTDDVLVTVCDRAHEELGNGRAAGRDTLHWSVPDPVPLGTDRAFDAVYDELVSRVAGLAPRLTHQPARQETTA